jgi:hypothetical protein
MNDNRSIDLLDEEQVNTRHDTTRVHAYLRFTQGEYILFVAPYRDLGGGVRGYPMGATEWKRVEVAPRFNAKRLAALAADPATLDLARDLAGGVE